MEAIETKELTVAGHTYRIRIYPDPDVPNPLTDWCEMGTILSLNRRHANFNPAVIDAALENNPDAVPLSYFEHGQCLWSVAGELSAECRCPWDSVALAGVWLPDPETLASAKHYGGRTRQLFMRIRARQACEAYTQWCNGEVYGYEVERVTHCGHCSEERAEFLDSCWGFFGRDNCLREATTVAQSRAAGLPPAPAPVRAARFEIENEPEENPDRVYVLVDGLFDVKIVRTDEGIVVDVYPKEGIEPIASTYAFDSDAEGDPDESIAPATERP